MGATEAGGGGETRLYHEAIVALARAAHGEGRLEGATASATVDNPLCGDRVTIDLVRDGSSVAEVGQRVRGCLLCEAAASAIGRRAPGCSGDELAAVSEWVRSMLAGTAAPEDAPWPELALFAPVRDFRSRHVCVTLPFEALEKALT